MKFPSLLFFSSIAFLGLLLSCNPVTTNDSTNNSSIINSPNDDSSWLIPEDQVFVGADRDAIPSIDQPTFVPAGEISHLNDQDMVVGVKVGDQIRAYPHRVLNYHEIVNDQIAESAIAVTFCPLSGSAVAWDREINGEVTEFGVSGLIHKNNLIAYDRKTDSYWSQMLEKSVYGDRIGSRPKRIHLIEMNWGAWKSIFPNSEVLTGETGFQSYYSTPPYGNNYDSDDNNIVFPIHREDDRLNRKDIGHGVLYNQDLYVYPMKEFPDYTIVFNRNVAGRNLVIIGNSSHDFITSFSAETTEGDLLRFSTTDKQPPALFEDDEGNIWNYFGEAIEGPRTGQKLQVIPSYNAYWFAWVDFYGLDPRRPHIATP